MQFFPQLIDKFLFFHVIYCSCDRLSNLAKFSWPIDKFHIFIRNKLTQFMSCSISVWKFLWLLPVTYGQIFRFFCDGWQISWHFAATHWRISQYFTCDWRTNLAILSCNRVTNFAIFFMWPIDKLSDFFFHVTNWQISWSFPVTDWRILQYFYRDQLTISWYFSRTEWWNLQLFFSRLKDKFCDFFSARHY